MHEGSDPSQDEAADRRAEALGAPVAHESEPFCGRHLIRRQKSRRPRSRLRRFGLAAATFALSVSFLIAIGSGLAFLRLSQGPLPVDLKPQIVAALNGRVGHGYRFDLGDTAIEATDHGPALTITHLSVADASARPIVSAPRAAISLDPMSLLVGKVAPNRLDIHDVDVRLLILPDGQVAVSTGSDDAAAFPLSSAFSGASRSAHGPASSDAAGADGIPGSVVPGNTAPRPGNAALRALSAAMRSLVEATTDPDSAMNSMDRVRVTGRLVLDDRTHGTKTIFSNTDLSFDRAPDGAVVLSVAADGPSGRWSLVARAAAAPDGVKILTVEANDLSLDEITLAGGLRGVGFDFDMPLSAQLTIKLGSDGEIDTAKGSFSLGAGYFKLDDPDHEPLLVDSVAGGFHLDSTTNGVAIDRTELRAGESVFGLTGHVDLPRSPGDPWAVRADASGIFGTERPGEKPIRIAHAGMAFRVVPGEHRFVVDKLDVAGPEIDFEMTSDLHAEGSGFRLKNVATVKHMPAQALVRLWPSFIAAPVRAWLLANLKGGTVEAGTATADLTDADLALMRAEHAVADDHVHVTFAVSNLSLAFMQGVPSLDGIEARGVVTGRTFNMDVQKGAMDVGQGRRLTLADGNLHIPDTDPKPTPAVIEAHVLGAVDVLTELLSRDALKPYANLPADGAAMKGQVDGHLTVATRFGDHVPPDETKIGVSAAATGFGIDKLIGKEGLSDATLKFDVDKTGLHAKGDGRIYGAPATLDFRKPPTGNSEAAIAMVLDDAARTRAGVSASAGLKGSVAAKITATMTPDDKTKAAVELDFAKAAIDEVVPGFSKPLGRPAKASFTVQTRDSGVTLDNIAFDGGGTSLRGSADLDRDGGFSSARLSQVRLSPGDDLKLDAQQTGDVLKIVARGLQSRCPALPEVAGRLCAAQRHHQRPGIRQGIPRPRPPYRHPHRAKQSGDHRGRPAADAARLSGQEAAAHGEVRAAADHDLDRIDRQRPALHRQLGRRRREPAVHGSLQADGRRQARRQHRVERGAARRLCHGARLRDPRRPCHAQARHRRLGEPEPGRRQWRRGSSRRPFVHAVHEARSLFHQDGQHGSGPRRFDVRQPARRHGRRHDRFQPGSGQPVRHLRAALRCQQPLLAGAALRPVAGRG